MISKLQVSLEVLFFFGSTAFFLFFTETGKYESYVEIIGEIDMMTVSCARFNKALQIFKRKKLNTPLKRFYAYFEFIRDYFLMMCLWYITRQLVLIFVHADLGPEELSIKFLTKNFILEIFRDLLITFAFYAVNLKWILELVTDNIGEYYRFLSSLDLYNILLEKTVRNSIITHDVYKDHLRRVAYLGTNGAHKGVIYDFFFEGRINISGYLAKIATYGFVGVYQILAVTNTTPSTFHIGDGIKIDLINLTCLICYMFHANFSWVIKSQFEWILTPIHDFFMGDSGFLNKSFAVVFGGEDTVEQKVEEARKKEKIQPKKKKEEPKKKEKNQKKKQNKKKKKDEKKVKENDAKKEKEEEENNQKKQNKKKKKRRRKKNK